MCMESAMIYNLPLLFALYAVMAALHCAVATAFPIENNQDYWQMEGIILLTVIVTGWIWMTPNLLQPVVIVILSCVAATIHGLLRRFVYHWGRYFRLKLSVGSVTISLIAHLALAQLMVGVGYLLLGHGEEGRWSSLVVAHVDSVIFLACILFVYSTVLLTVGGEHQHPSVSSLPGRYQYKVAFATLVLIVLPVLVAGQLVLLAWEGTTRIRSWSFLFTRVVPVGLASLCPSPPSTDIVHPIRRHDDDQMYKDGWTRRGRAIVGIMILLLGVCPFILQRGAGFRVGYLLPLFSFMDLIDSLRLAILRPTSKEGRKAK